MVIENIHSFCVFYKALVLQSLWNGIFFELADNEPLGCRMIVNLREATRKFELLDIFLYYMRNEAQ
jgi:hypothetical protein